MVVCVDRRTSGDEPTWICTFAQSHRSRIPTHSVEKVTISTQVLRTRRHPFRTTWRIALDELDRVLEHKPQFGEVLTDAGFGACSEFSAEHRSEIHNGPLGYFSTPTAYFASVRVIPGKPSVPQTGAANPAHAPLFPLCVVPSLDGWLRRFRPVSALRGPCAPLRAAMKVAKRY